MQLDDVIATTSPDSERIKEAMHRSVRWLDRCIAAHQNPRTQNLFCIIQGGLDLELRRECCKEMVARDTPGIAIGGLSGGEEKAEFCKVVSTCTDLFPANKPRYVMGVSRLTIFLPASVSLRLIVDAPSQVGYPEDILVAVALGADMFDCVWPTRTARFGNAITNAGVLNLRHASFAYDFEPVAGDCRCLCCKKRSEGGLGITRAYIHHTAAKETVGAHLLTMHNVHYMLDLVKRAQEAIINDAYPEFLKEYFGTLYAGQKEKFPSWAVEALRTVGVDLLED
jgi:queuine tRNA-ribosyltransferase